MYYKVKNKKQLIELLNKYPVSRRIMTEEFSIYLFKQLPK